MPRVSPYRLAAHLTSAFAIFTGLAWTAMSLAQPVPLAAASASAAAALQALRGRLLPVAGLVAVTAGAHIGIVCHCILMPAS